MKAFQLTRWQAPAELREVPVPEPGPGQVLLRVAGSGVCGSDLHLMGWPEGKLALQLPFTLGHEVSGWVEQLGEGVEDLEPGEPVLVYGSAHCGRCKRCHGGREQYCDEVPEIKALCPGLGHDGGMAQYMLVRSARLLVPLNDLETIDAAPLADAGLTAYHAIKASFDRLGPGSAAVVIGIGGVGDFAVQILKALTPAKVIALDISSDQLGKAKFSGADEVLLSNELAVDRVKAATRGKGADAVFDMVGSHSTLALAAKLVAPMGKISLVGFAGGLLPFSFSAVPYECSVTASYWGTLPELHEVVELARAGKIHTRVERFGLEKVAEAYQRLKSGMVHGRAVVTPNL